MALFNSSYSNGGFLFNTWLPSLVDVEICLSIDELLEFEAIIKTKTNLKTIFKLINF